MGSRQSALLPCWPGVPRLLAPPAPALLWAGGGHSAITEGCSSSQGLGAEPQPLGAAFGPGWEMEPGITVAGGSSRGAAAPWGCRDGASSPSPARACPARLVLAEALAPAQPPGLSPDSAGQLGWAGSSHCPWAPRGHTAALARMAGARSWAAVPTPFPSCMLAGDGTIQLQAL